MKTLFFSLSILIAFFTRASAQQNNYRIIGHRGGVVNSEADENSYNAMVNAAKAGYWMIETDLRQTADGVLVTHHDSTLKRTFGIDSAVSDMSWARLHSLVNKGGYRIQKFEDVLKYCSGKMGIMIDNKIKGNPVQTWQAVVALLKKYNMYKNALLIGTTASNPFFTGRIKISCTRAQLESYMKKPGFSPNNYYLFDGRISADDVSWASKHKILTVGTINSAPQGAEYIKAGQDLRALKAAGVRNFQVDSYLVPFIK